MFECCISKERDYVVRGIPVGSCCSNESLLRKLLLRTKYRIQTTTWSLDLSRLLSGARGCNSQAEKIARRGKPRAGTKKDPSFGGAPPFLSTHEHEHWPVDNWTHHMPQAWLSLREWGEQGTEKS